MTIRTREAWLHDAVDQFRPWFAAHDAPLPRDLRVSVGFPLGNRKAIGQCWYEDASADELRHIFISPVLANATSPQGVLATLLHECAHAALPLKAGHRAPFAKLAGNLGLVKPWTATKAGPELLPRLVTLAEDLGAFPHGALSLKLKPGRKNPYKKCECEACGFICYATPKMVGDNGPLVCPACQSVGFAGDGYTPEDPEDNHARDCRHV